MPPFAWARWAKQPNRPFRCSWSPYKVKTPTLIHVGGNDERCPPGHSRMLYRALKEYVNVPTELIVYPGAYHSFDTPRPGRRYFGHWLEYNPAAAEAATEETRRFLAEQLR